MQGHTTEIERPAPAPVVRPWGSYQSAASDDGYQVKRIVLAPGASLSRQRHACRAEHWVVVTSIASVELDGHAHELAPNQSIYIARHAVHRLINRTAQPVVLIAVQCGDYLGEDDIERLDDIYGRT